jgi:hypothetical protein
LQLVVSLGTRAATLVCVAQLERLRREATSTTIEQSQDMPVISKFYGIVIRMLFIRPFVAHFHAFYGDCELVVGINPLKIVQGDAPGRVRSMVMEWALQHQRELLEDWSRLGRAQSAQPIEPLV